VTPGKKWRVMYVLVALYNTIEVAATDIAVLPMRMKGKD
jgi:hypothetical protein